MKLADFHHDTPVNDVAGLKRSISNKLVFTIGKDPVVAKPEDWLRAASMAVRDRLVEHWMHTTRAQHEHDVKRAYYLSAEFLIGRAFTNALLALGIHDNLRQALAELDVEFDHVVDLEHDAALGNGGLGRLAACFLDSMATIGVPGMGYGIRYDYGMFRQRIVDGRQVETPDYWLVGGNPWEFPRPEIVHRVRFGGHLEHHGDEVRWVGTQDVLAMAYDTIIPGYDTTHSITLRLWSARATTEIDLSAFNQGNYMGAVEDKNHSENVSRVLYPDDSTPSGRELRLRQEYFFCSASLQDLVHRYKTRHERFDQLPVKVAIHLNDTHPVLAVPELVRILMDDHGMPFGRAWEITRRCFGYTNHTLMHEALETWPVEMLGRVLPRHLKIIFDINAEFLAEVSRRNGITDPELMRRISLVDEHGERRVRMAYLAVVASTKVNGVSKLHSELMKASIFADFATIYPEKFNNKTNGITPRRWLSQANRPLATLIDSRIGATWRRNLDELAKLRPLVDDAAFVAAFRAAKRQNKERLARWVSRNMGSSLNIDSLFDVQVKRIHEYKRQLLNVLHVITRYNRIKARPDAPWVPRTVIIAGKAASAYHMAKQIIKLVNDVAAVVNRDADVGDKLKVIFVPNYGVSLAETIIPAADLSEQISTAGTEASGTGNMKFALNGALTIGTLDGANVEIREQVGDDNIFIFGLTTPQVEAVRRGGYQPRVHVDKNAELARALAQIRDGAFSPGEPSRHQAIYDTLVNWGDHYLLLADYEAYIAAQERVDVQFVDGDAWARKAILNVAGMGMFSSDRTIAEYAREIWGIEPARG